MNNIRKVLKGIIQQLNNSIKKTPQKLTDDEKKQVKDNLGIVEQTVVQADYSQNDSTAPDYIKGRTHWKVENTMEILPTTVCTKDNYSFQTKLSADAFKEDDTIVFIVDGVEHVARVKIDSKGYYVTAVTQDNEFYISNGMGDSLLTVVIGQYNYWDSHTQCQVQVLGKYNTYQTLHDDYIPESIARRDEIQGDWNSHKQYDPHYIHNRPFYHKEVTRVELFSDNVKSPFDNQTVPYDVATESWGDDQFEVRVNYDHLGTMKLRGHSDFMGAYLGNLSFIDTKYENTGEDFLIIWNKGDAYSTVYLSDRYSSESSVYLQIYRVEPEELVQLDEKFIPDTIARIADIQQAVLSDDDAVELLNQLNT